MEYRQQPVPLDMISRNTGTEPLTPALESGPRWSCGCRATFRGIGPGEGDGKFRYVWHRCGACQHRPVIWG